MYSLYMSVSYTHVTVCMCVCTRAPLEMQLKCERCLRPCGSGQQKCGRRGRQAISSDLIPRVVNICQPVTNFASPTVQMSKSFSMCRTVRVLLPWQRLTVGVRHCWTQSRAAQRAALSMALQERFVGVPEHEGTVTYCDLIHCVNTCQYTCPDTCQY